MLEGTWDKSEQERKAQEERRQREIMDKIHALEQKKRVYQGRKAQLYCQNTKLEEIISQINILASMGLEADGNFFSCATKDMTDAGAAQAQTAMREKNYSFSALVSASEGQIRQLESCICGLEDKIRELEAEL